MSVRLWIGFGLTLLAGLFSGTCMLPMKFARRQPWESVWLIFSIVSLLILPWSLALLEVPHLFGVYSALPGSDFVAPLLFGAGWGIAQVLFGLSIARLGMALGYAIIVGLGALLGTLIPLFVRHREIAASSRGLAIFGGIAIMILGIGVAAWAGQKREPQGANEERAPRSSYGAAVALAILCGFMAPMLNYAFAFGDSIAIEAVRQGHSSETAGYAVWPIALLGGLLPNVGYAVFLLLRNRSWTGLNAKWQPDLWCGGLMAVLWMGAFAIYGVSSVYLGPLGTSAGWALFQIFMIMTANCAGIFTAEWRNAPGSAKWGIATSLVLLASATALLAPRE
ncbi:MAG: L-rhamnose/proton symporter RhaT [Bryobacteraceae bacterium]